MRSIFQILIGSSFIFPTAQCHLKVQTLLKGSFINIWSTIDQNTFIQENVFIVDRHDHYHDDFSFVVTAA